MVYSKVRKNKRAHLKWNVAVSVAEAGPLIPARTVRGDTCNTISSFYKFIYSSFYKFIYFAVKSAQQHET
jgi:hypothetical protein